MSSTACWSRTSVLAWAPVRSIFSILANRLLLTPDRSMVPPMASRLTVSMPEPPSRSSGSAPPTTMLSLPAPPWKLSAPPLPIRVSLPWPPTKVSAAAVPVKRVGRRRAGEHHAAGEIPAEDHGALARVGLGVAGRVAEWSPDDQVVEAVAVDVAGRRHRTARLVACVGAEDAEALGRRQRRQVDVGKARRLAEDHDSSRPRRSWRCRTRRRHRPRRSGRRSRRR